MFGRSRSAKAQQVAEDAWDALSSAWESARGRTGDLVGDTQGRVGTVTDEAMRRAGAAFDALAGRRPSPSWGLIIAVAAAGAAVGWAIATAVGRAPDLSAFAEEADSETPGVTTP